MAGEEVVGSAGIEIVPVINDADLEAAAKAIQAKLIKLFEKPIEITFKVNTDAVLKQFKTIETAAAKTFGAIEDSALSAASGIDAIFVAAAESANASLAKIKGVNTTNTVNTVNTSTTSSTSAASSSAAASSSGSSASEVQAQASAEDKLAASIAATNAEIDTQITEIELQNASVDQLIASTVLLEQATFSYGVSVGLETKALNDSAAAAERNVVANDANNASLKQTQSQLLGLKTLIPVAAAVFSVVEVSKFNNALATTNILFGESAPEIQKFATTLPSALGLSSSAALKLAADFGTVITNLGFSQGTAATATEALTKRAADIAAASGKSVTDVANTLKLALEGNSRGLKQLGVDISSVDIKNKALALGFGDQVSKLTDAQKAAVFYSLTLEKTDKFQGFATSSADTLAGSIRTLKTDAQDAAVTLGQDLAGGAQTALGALDGLVTLFESLPAPIRKVVEALVAMFVTFKATSSITALTSAFGGLVIGLGGIAPAAAAAEEGLAGLEVAEAGATGGLSLIPALIAGAVGALVLFGGSSKSAAGDIDTLKGSITEVNGAFAATPKAAAAFFGATNFKNLNTDITNINAEADALAKIPGLLDEIVAAQANGIADSELTGQAKTLNDDLNAVAANGKSVEEAIKNVTKAVDAGSVTAAKAAAQQILDPTNRKKVLDAIDQEIARRKALSDQQRADEDALNGEASASQNAADALKTLSANFKTLESDQKSLKTETENLGKAQRTLTEDQAALKILNAEGGAKELADARQKVADATLSAAGATTALTKAQQALDELKAIDVARLHQDAADAVTSAEIRQRAAVEALQKAQDALNASQDQTGGTLIDLNGKTIEQIKEILANQRATAAAAAKSSSTATSTAQTQADLADAVLQAQIDLRKATEDVTDAKKAQSEVDSKHAQDIADAQAAFASAQNSSLKATNDLTAAQDSLSKKLAGQTEFAKALQAANDKIADDNQRIADLNDQIKDTNDKILADRQAVLGVETSITKELLAQLAANKAIFANNAAAQRSLVENLLTSIGATIDHGGGNIGATQHGDFGDSTITNLFNDLAAGNVQAFKDLLKRIGVNFQAFAEGGVINGVNNPFGRLVRVGEMGRREIIAPMENPLRAAQLLGNDPAWPKIASLLPKYEAPAPVNLNTQSFMGSGGNTSSVTPEMRKMLSLLEEIRDRTKGVTVDAPITIEAKGMDETLVARRAIQMLERELRNL